MRICLIRPDHLGDIILCTPLMRALGKAGQTVDFVGPQSLIPILEGNKYLADTFSLESICPTFPRGWGKLAGWLRSRKYDVILLPYGQAMSLLLASLFSGTKIRIAMWAGVPGRLTFHKCLRSGLPDLPRHFSRIMLDMLTPLNIPDDGIRLDVFLSPDEIQTAKQSLPAAVAECQHIVGIHPGCAGNTCNLPGTEYGRLAETLLKDPKNGIVITGSKSELSLLESWPKGTLESPRIWNSMGLLSLRQLAATISLMDLYCVPSTGPLHIASALEIPTISPFCNRNTLSDGVWGNLGGKAYACKPPPAGCESHWRHSNKCCNFRGEVTGKTLCDVATHHLENNP